MTSSNVKKVVIVGGGTAGWMTASLLAKVLGKAINITLVESDAIGTIGVGEASIPPIVNFNQAIGITEKDFLNATKGTIKLGIEFNNWHHQGDSYMHAFGSIGKKFPFCDFHHFWLKHQLTQGFDPAKNSQDYWNYSLNYQAAKRNKFAKIPSIPNTNLPGIAYAYHFDAGLYAKFLSQHAQKQGVERIEGTISQVQVNPDNGFIDALTLENTEKVEGDLFVDCSGLHALLIEKTLATGYQDWSHWLPCNRAMALPSESSKAFEPYTRSTAQRVGWQWRIPLQHRTGNGLVYSDKHLSDDEAKQILLSNLDGKPIGEPRVIGFRTGRRRKVWNKNVVCIGLSSGFLEPLESTNIHLVQAVATRLVKFFPHNGFVQHEVDLFNQLCARETEGIRDFIIMHYKLNARRDTAFWRYCEQMEIPDSLARKIALFNANGKTHTYSEDLFTDIAWQQVLIGQGVIPKDYHALVNSLSDTQIQELMDSLLALTRSTVDTLPLHSSFLEGTNNSCH